MDSIIYLQSRLLQKHIGKKILIAAFVLVIIQVSYYYHTIGEVGKEDYDYSVILALGSGGTSNGRFNVPHSVAFDSMGYIYVSDTNKELI